MFVTTTSAGTASGFPFRLAGEAISVTARIVGVAEAFDEMIHSTARKREPWSVRRALEELLAPARQSALIRAWWTC